MKTPEKDNINQKPSGTVRAADPDRSITSETLLGSLGRLQIHHAGEAYLLRVTRKGRLILTK